MLPTLYIILYPCVTVNKLVGKAPCMIFSDGALTMLFNLQAVSQSKVRMYNSLLAQEMHRTGNLKGKVHFVLDRDRLQRKK